MFRQQGGQRKPAPAERTQREQPVAQCPRNWLMVSRHSSHTRDCAQRHSRQLRRKLRPDARERFQIARLILVPNSGVRITPAMRGTEQQAILDALAVPEVTH